MLRVGIVGSGFGMYGLLPAFARAKNCQVTSICAKKSDQLLTYCKKYKVKQIYSDWRELLLQERIGALAIAVTPQAQYEIAKTAMKRGIHIFAEKPLAANIKQALELSRLAERNKIITAVDFIFPEIPEWAAVKEQLQKERFGKLLHVDACWDFLSYDIAHNLRSWKTDVSQGGGALSFYFSHVVYYLEYFAGEISVCKGLLSQSPKSLNGGEVGVDVIFQTRKGISGSAHLHCCASGIKRHSLTFICEQGTLILENNKNVSRDFSITAYTGSKTYAIKCIRKRLPNGEDERIGAVRSIAERFVEGCLTKKPMSPSFREGVRVQKLITQIRKN